MIDAQENPEMARKFDVTNAPTLVVIDSGDVKNISTAFEIKRYARGK